MTIVVTVKELSVGVSDERDLDVHHSPLAMICVRDFSILTQ